MMMLRETCTLCSVPFGNAGRYRGDGGTGVWEICEKCAEKIAALQRSSAGPELEAMLSKLLLAAAPAQGSA
jgi:hypothetical protein